MTRSRIRLLLLAGALAAAAALGGCGQTGPLVLPDEAAQEGNEGG